MWYGISKALNRHVPCGMGQTASLVSPMDLCQQWLYVTNHRQNLNLANVVGPFPGKVLSKSLWEHVHVRKRALSVPGGMCLFVQENDVPTQSFIWKGTEIITSPLWWDLIGMMTLTGRTRSFQPHLLHCKACLCETCPSHTRAHLTHPLPQLLPCSACCLRQRRWWTNSIWFPP